MDDLVIDYIGFSVLGFWICSYERLSFDGKLVCMMNDEGELLGIFVNPMDGGEQ